MDSDSYVSADRGELILRELLRNGQVSVDSLAKSFNVSAATIRRDLTDLERQGLLRRNHGGAVSVAPMLYEAFRHVSSFQEQEQECVAEKRRIGLAAAGLIGDGEIIAIGAGTTTTLVARSIRHRKAITVVTNAVNIAMELSHLPDIKVCVTGGYLSGDWFAVVGDMAQRNVSEIFVDKVFIGVDGFHSEHGLTTNYPDQAAIHRTMMRQARQRVVVADHRKIGLVGTSLIWPAADIDILVTDKATTDEALAPFADKKIVAMRA
ncbi:MAG TPA: DeoR/GlpR family DNA-binding transcription regulator [Blastocatellia bacterium]|nr:DeoR/GlpR family DNA-binding transcription regulator [Blastocatellia bacterium]